MTPEMQRVALQLFELAAQFRKMQEEHTGQSGPVIPLTNNETGDCIFIATRFDANIIKTILKPMPPVSG